jgi:23S rRNA pseudouridine1911/1915/1917 synthase
LIPIIFQDDALIVFDKPANLVVTKSETQQTNTLEDILTTELGITLDRGGVVHRLDKDTSGLIVVAKTIDALESLQAQFKGREVKKRYIALVHGQFTKPRIVEGAVARNPGDREKFIVVEEGSGIEGKEAVTEFKPIEQRVMSDQVISDLFPEFSKIQLRKLHASRYPLFTLLECFPQTGRTHQIRVHLKHIGFPIVGDSKYGGRKTVRLDHRWCKRQFLHAADLTFKHPKSGRLMEFKSELPEDLVVAYECCK